MQETKKNKYCAHISRFHDHPRKEYLDIRNIPIIGSKRPKPVEDSSDHEKSHAKSRKERRNEKQEGLPVIYGNYPTYYAKRNSSASLMDSRLELINEEWIIGKRVLDIGCNSGHVTSDIGFYFGLLK